VTDLLWMKITTITRTFWIIRRDWSPVRRTTWRCWATWVVRVATASSRSCWTAAARRSPSTASYLRCSSPWPSSRTVSCASFWLSRPWGPVPAVWNSEHRLAGNTSNRHGLLAGVVLDRSAVTGSCSVARPVPAEGFCNVWNSVHTKPTKNTCPIPLRSTCRDPSKHARSYK